MFAENARLGYSCNAPYALYKAPRSDESTGKVIRGGQDENRPSCALSQRFALWQRIVERASMLRGGARRGHHRRVTPAPRGGARRRGPLSREAKVEQGGTIGRAGDGPRTPRKRTRRSALPTLPLPVGLRRSRVPVIPFVPTVVFPAGVAVVRGHGNNRSFSVSDVSHMYDKNEWCEKREISHLSRSRRRACLSALERTAHRIPFSFSRARQNASMYCAAISSGGFVYRWMYRCER